MASRKVKPKDQLRLPATLGGLAADPRNPRQISKTAAGGLSVSLAEFGDLSGIVFNSRTGQLVCGHQRVGQIKSRWGDLPIHSGAITTAEGHRFAVRVVDWPAAKQLAANVAANSQRIAGEFTDDLDLLLAEIKAATPELFDSLLFGELLSQPVPGVVEDDVPEPPKKPITKPGDLWLLGDHRLLCGDSSKADDVARLMNGERAGLMNTDPPYGVSYANDERPNPGVAKPRVANDGLTDQKLQAFLEMVFRAATGNALLDRAAWYLWHAHLTQGYFAAAAAANVVLHRQIIWVKPVLLLGRGQYHWKHEPCFMGWVEGKQPPDYGAGNGERTQTTVWEICSVSQQERRELNHSTPKPVQLFVIPIVKHLKSGAICFEPFAGSGPQFIAAEQLGRRCYGIEIDPKFCDVIVTRWEKLTGQKAKLERASTTRTKHRRKAS